MLTVTLFDGTIFPIQSIVEDYRQDNDIRLILRSDPWIIQKSVAEIGKLLTPENLVEFTISIGEMEPLVYRNYTEVITIHQRFNEAGNIVEIVLSYKEEE